MITTSVFSCSKNVPQYDLIFVDEAQDLNKAQQALLMASLAPNGRFVAVGDPKQAINGFAGADCESFANLKQLANGKEYPLSVCYRCGKKIVELAQTLVPSISAFDGAEMGEIRHASDMVGVRKGDMVLCRKTAPLVGMCLKLIANGIPSNVLGRDMASGIKNLIVSTKAKTLDKLFEKLYHQIDLAIGRAQRKGLDPTTTASVVSLQDKVACIEAVSEGCTSVSAILSRIDDMFIDRDANAQGDANKAKNIVSLSTIHKAKGLEADNVWIIAPEKLPLRFEGQKDWEYEQELNLCYVAYTRAKKVLTFVDVREKELGGVAVA
jgi:superfamily I DNA/RNA helicase